MMGFIITIMICFGIVGILRNSYFLRLIFAVVDFRRRYARRCTIFSSVAAVLIIVSIELGWPSLALTGKIDIHLRIPTLSAYDGEVTSKTRRTLPFLPQPALYDGDITYSELGSSTSFLRSLRQYNGTYWQEMEGAARQQLISDGKEYKRKLDEVAIGLDGIYPTDPLEFGKLLAAGQVNRKDSRRAKFLKSKLVRLGVYEIEARTKLQLPRLSVPDVIKKTFDPALIIEPWTEPVLLHEGSMKERLIPKLLGPSANESWWLLQRIKKNLLRERRSLNRAWRGANCWLGIYDTNNPFAPPTTPSHRDMAGKVLSGKSALAYGARHCDVILPVSMTYDVTSNEPCRSYASAVVPSIRRGVHTTQTIENSMDSTLTSAMYCIERWTWPSLHIRVDEIGLLVYPPRSDAHMDSKLGLRDPEVLPLTRWSLRIGGENYPLYEETRIPWMEIEHKDHQLADFELHHQSKWSQQELRWWRNLRVDSGFLDEPEKLIASPAYTRSHKFEPGIRNVPGWSELKSVMRFFPSQLLFKKARAPVPTWLLGRTIERLGRRGVFASSPACDVISKVGPYINLAALKYTRIFQRSSASKTERPKVAVSLAQAISFGVDESKCREIASKIKLLSALADQFSRYSKDAD